MTGLESRARDTAVDRPHPAPTASQRHRTHRPSQPSTVDAMPSGDDSDASADGASDSTTPPEPDRRTDDADRHDPTEPPGRGDREDAPRHHQGRDVPLLLDETDDRWAWRRRIRADPRKARIYRIGVGALGVLLILLGAATGWLPGPGGIPLVLLGLGVLSTEFEWAQRLMQWFLRVLRRFQALTRPQQVLIWVVVIVVVLTVVYSYLLIAGVPIWAPAAVADVLHRLPGL